MLRFRFSLQVALLPSLMLFVISVPFTLISLREGEAAEPPPTSSHPSKPGDSGSPAGTPVQLPQGPRQEILNVVVQQHRANLGHMQTWTGTVIVSDQTIDKKQLTSKTIFEIDFAVDRVHDAFRWNRRTVEAIVLQNGKEVSQPPQELLLEGGMRKGDDFYRLGPRKSDARHHIVSVNTPRALRPAPASTDFDPLYYFTANGMKLDERFQFFYEDSGSPISSWKTSRNKDRVTVESDVPISINRYVVDLSVGANLVELYLLDRDKAGKGTLECKTTWEYEKISDVWVPKRIAYYNDNRLRGTRIDRTIDWKNQRVNEALPDDTFSLAALGARPGDEVVDMRSRVRAKVPGEKTAKPPKEVHSSRRQLWLALVGAFLLVLSATILVLRKYLRARRAE